MFEKFTKNLNKTGGVAYLSGGKQRKLLFKGKLKEQFVEGDKVEMYFDKESKSIGVVKTDNGYSVTFNGGQLGVSVNAFCNHYGLAGIYTVADFTKEGEMYVLPLKEVKNV